MTSTRLCIGICDAHHCAEYFIVLVVVDLR